MNRLLSIGFPLPWMDVDNYTALTAPSYFDYETLLVDPDSITRNVGELLESTREFEAFDGRPVLNGAGTADTVSAGAQLQRRAAETQRLLEAGGVVLVTARPNAVRHGLLGFEGCDRYHWLPAPAGISWGPPVLRAAEGKTVRIENDDHPLSSFLRTYRGEISYRAVFDDRHAAFRQGARVVASGGGGMPIAVEFAVLGGRVVFLPAIGDPGSHIRSQIAEVLVDVARALLRESVSVAAPYWEGQVEVPGLAPIEATLRDAELLAASAAAQAAGARDQFSELARYRRMLWESGANLREIVAEALRLLGFAVTLGEGDDPMTVVEADGERAAIETEGDRAQVVEWPYVRLQRRLEDRLIKRNERFRGLIVVNGYRLSPPEGRQQEYSDALRIASENYRYTLLTGRTLFAMVTRALEGASEADLLGMRRRLMSTNGLLDLDAALGDAKEAASEPLF